MGVDERSIKRAVVAAENIYEATTRLADVCIRTASQRVTYQRKQNTPIRRSQRPDNPTSRVYPQRDKDRRDSQAESAAYYNIRLAGFVGELVQRRRRTGEWICRNGIGSGGGGRRRRRRYIVAHCAGPQAFTSWEREQLTLARL